MYAALFAALAAGQTVVTANQRLTRTLLQQYDLYQQRAGSVAWPSPAVSNGSHWLQQLWAESRLRGGAALEYVLLDEASADLLWQQCIGATETDRPELPLAAFATSARTAWKLVNDWDALGAAEWTRTGLGPDQQAWLRWSGAFRARCAQAGWIDPERLVASLTADVRAGVFDELGPIHFAGFDVWPPVWLELKKALHERGVVVVDAETHELAAQLAGRPCTDARSELLAAARWARSCIESNEGALVGVVVPDLANRAAEVRRVFLDVFAPDWRSSGVAAELPLNVSFGKSLADMPVVHTALLLLRLAGERASFRDFSLLLRSVWLNGAAAEYSQRARLELELRGQLRFEFALQDALAVCRKRAPQFAVTLEALLEPAAHEGRQSVREWATLFSTWLRSAGWPGDARVDSETWQALKSWNELLAAFARSATVQGEAIDRGAALTWLTELAQQRLFQPEGVADSVQVMGALQAAGLAFDHLWVCGMARELWPAVGRASAFVPLDLQRRLGMPDSTATNTLEYAARITQRLLACAADVIVSWPLQQDGEALHPSPLIGRSLPAVAVEILANDSGPLWNELIAAHGRTEWLEQDPPPPLTAEQPVRGGASVLNLQAISPLNAFIEKRLGAAEIQAPPLGIDARERGNLVHRALELFYTECPDRATAAALSLDEQHARLAAALREALAALPGINDAFIQKIADFELAQQLPRLAAFVELDLQRPDFRVVACEQTHSVAIGKLQLRLKLDRLDELAGGRKLVIDYKTGGINRQAWNPAKPRDLQLPLYVTAVVPGAAAVAFAQISVQGIQYDGVGVPDTNIVGIRAPGSRAVVEVKYQHPRTGAVIQSWDELRDAWAELLHALAQQFADGDYRLDPRNPASARGQFAVLSRIYDTGIGVYEDDV